MNLADCSDRAVGEMPRRQSCRKPYGRRRTDDAELRRLNARPVVGRSMAAKNVALSLDQRRKKRRGRSNGRMSKLRVVEPGVRFCRISRLSASKNQGSDRMLTA